MQTWQRLIFTPLICALCCLPAAAQLTPLQIFFKPVMANSPLNLYEGFASDSLRVTTFRCYVSSFSLWQDSKEVWREQNSYHLLDAAQAKSMSIALNPPAGIRYNRLRFDLGIDSVTNTNGAHGGDLDPVQGMYWAWQSGYINFKLEGISPLSTARKHEFHFHLGGYQKPYVAMQEVNLAVYPSPTLIVNMDLAAFLHGIDLAKQNSIMIPGAEAFVLSQKAVTIFRVQP